MAMAGIDWPRDEHSNVPVNVNMDAQRESIDEHIIKEMFRNVEFFNVPKCGDVVFVRHVCLRHPTKNRD